MPQSSDPESIRFRGILTGADLRPYIGKTIRVFYAETCRPMIFWGRKFEIPNEFTDVGKLTEVADGMAIFSVPTSRPGNGRTIFSISINSIVRINELD